MIDPFLFFSCGDGIPYRAIAIRADYAAKAPRAAIAMWSFFNQLSALERIGLLLRCRNNLNYLKTKCFTLLFNDRIASEFSA
jgi:hypothetical protein